MARGRRLDNAEVFIAASAAWSLVVFVVAAVALTGTFGTGVLAFAAVPTVLTTLTALLIRLTRRSGHALFKLSAAVLAGLVGLAVMTSFIIPAFALLPSCALLIAAVAQPSNTSSSPKIG